MEEGFEHGGRLICRNFGSLPFVVFAAWDLYDHHRMVSQNKPIMRRLLNDYFDELEEQVLTDSQNGIFQTLETVRQTIAERYEEGQ